MNASKVFKWLAIYIIVIFAVVTMRPSRADAEIASVYIDLAPTPTPPPAPTLPPRPYVEYEWSEAEIDGLASVYWAECNTDAEKLAVTQLVINRTQHGAPFASDIVGVVHQRGEFNRGHISDANRALAKTNLNKIASGLCSVPKSAVYMGRDGRTLIMYDFEWNIVWTSKK